jgi:spermidine synthase
LNSIVLLLFALSGLTGLVYEVLWRKTLSIVLGGTIFATAVVLSSFMAGLFLGAVVAGRWADRWRNPLRAYGIFEVLIAGFAVVFPVLCRLLISMQRLLYSALQDHPLASNGLGFAASFILLLLPTFLMGGTFPLLIKFYVRNPVSVAKGVGRLYSVNTLGAVLGTLAAGFFLLRILGTQGTSWVAVALNALVGGAAILLSIGKSSLPSPVASSGKAASRDDFRPKRTAVLVALAFSGATALSYEVLWTRVLVFVVGTTTYSFTIMLSTFLLGLALGSFIFARFLSRRTSLFITAAVAEVLIGIFALIAMASTRSFYSLFERIKDLFPVWAYVPYTLSRYIIASAALLPQAVLFGMAFPAIVGICAGRNARTGGDVGWAYGSNTLGATLGSLVAVFILIPLLGLAASVLVTAFVNIVIGLVFLGFSPRLSSHAKTILAAGMLVVFGCIALVLPPRIDVGTSSRGLQGPRGTVVFYREGVSATVAVFLDPEQGLKMMQIDGNAQVPTDLDALQAFRLLGHLPFFVHPRPRDVLVTAFGGGITAGSILSHPVERVDAVEICPSVFDAAALFEAENDHVLKDKRLRLIVDDANHYVKVTDRTYDVIASDATHPAASESWVLYTQEFYSACRGLLREGGVMCQWVPLHALPTNGLKIILKTFQSVFPHTTLWFARGYIVMLGTPDVIEIDLQRINDILQRNKKASAQLHRSHLESPPAILKNLILDENAVRRFAGNSPLATEDKSPLAFAERQAVGRRMIPVNVLALSKAIVPDFPKIVGGTDSEQQTISAAARVRRSYLNAVRCWHLRQPVEGLRHLEEAFAAGPEDADLSWYLRWLTILALETYRKEKSLEQSIADFRRWSTVFPRSPWTKIALARFLIQKGHSRGNDDLLEEGFAELRRAADVAPQDPIVLQDVSRAFLAAGRDEQAIPFLEGLAAIRPNDPTSWGPLAWAYMAAKRYPASKQALLRAIELDPTNPAFPAALRRLEALLGTDQPSIGTDDDREPPPDEPGSR